MHILITMGLGIFGQDELFDVAKPVWRLRSLSQSLGEGDKKIGKRERISWPYCREFNEA